MATLYLIPTTLGNEDIQRTLPAYNQTQIAEVRYFIVEELRSARRFLRTLNHDAPIDEMQFFLLNEHTRKADCDTMLQPLLSGQDMGLLSEAGIPCIADPGSVVVRHAHRLGIKVQPLVGPSSLMMALMASGFNGQRFQFWGYQPIDNAQLSKRIKDMEQSSRKYDRTEIFIEAPYRNQRMLETICRSANPDTQLCIACDLTLDTETIITLPIREWKKIITTINFHKRPAVFLLYCGI